MIEHPAIPMYWAQLPGYFAIKDINGCYISCNNNLASIMRLNSPAEIVGLTDRDLADFNQQDYELHKKNDELALSGKIVECIHRSSYPYDGAVYKANKTPLMNTEQEIIGILFHCTKIINAEKIIELFKNDYKILTHRDTQRAYYIGTAQNPLDLSYRELECMFFTLRGFTAKQIANELGLSKRTIESYIENIKSKARCQTKAQLIDLSIFHGYHKTIPSKVLE